MPHLLEAEGLEGAGLHPLPLLQHGHAETGSGTLPGGDRAARSGPHDDESRRSSQRPDAVTVVDDGHESEATGELDELGHPGRGRRVSTSTAVAWRSALEVEEVPVAVETEQRAAQSRRRPDPQQRGVRQRSDTPPDRRIGDGGLLRAQGSEVASEEGDPDRARSPFDAAGAGQGRRHVGSVTAGVGAPPGPPSYSDGVSDQDQPRTGASEGAVVAVAIVVMNVATYGLTVAAARLMGPPGFGEFSAVMGILMVLNVLALGLQATGARRMAVAGDRAGSSRRSGARRPEGPSG